VNGPCEHFSETAPVSRTVPVSGAIVRSNRIMLGARGVVMADLQVITVPIVMFIATVTSCGVASGGRVPGITNSRRIVRPTRPFHSDVD